MRQYDILLFDADGTLFDYDRAEACALENMFVSYGLPWSEALRASYREINNDMWLRFEEGKISKEALQTTRFSLLFKALGVGWDADEFNQKYLVELGKGSFLLPGAAGLCERMRRKSKKMYIVTNGISSVQRSRIGNSEIKPYISELFVSEDIGFQKPHPSYFEYVVSHISCDDRTKMLIVGDSLTADIAGGNSAGIDACWINIRGVKNETDILPTYEIRDLMELDSIVI